MDELIDKLDNMYIDETHEMMPVLLYRMPIIKQKEFINWLTDKKTLNLNVDVKKNLIYIKEWNYEITVYDKPLPEEYGRNWKGCWK